MVAVTVALPPSVTLASALKVTRVSSSSLMFTVAVLSGAAAIT